MNRNAHPRGVTLVEVIVGTGVFLLVATSLYQSISAAYRAVRLSRLQVVAAALANEQFEIARNLTYADVGIVGGLPAGKIPYQQTLTRGNAAFVVSSIVRSVDDPFDGTIGGAPNDTSAADYKLYEVEIACASCVGFPPTVFSSNIAPKNLEGASTNGALFVQVIDASGKALADADVTVTNASATPPFTVHDVTGANGMLQLVDVPPGVNQYFVTVTKTGYSTERTYAPLSAVPNPVKPHGTVALQQVTQMSFLIDRLSILNVSSVTSVCAPAPNIDFSLTGSKLIGTVPDQLKYSQVFATDAAGLLTLPSMEFDSYQSAFNDTTFDLAGTVPLLPFEVQPNTSQNLQLIVALKNPRSILVTVKDAATQLPLTDATVQIVQGATDETLVTNRGFLRQTDWSGGSGQDDFSDTTKFLSSDGFIETQNPVGEMRLKNPGSGYVAAGELISSTFDTGSASNFYQMQWLPIDQPTPAGPNSLRYQIATNNDNATWLYSGPDGTGATYYSSSNTNISPINNGDRYLRYKAFLSTEDASSTPNVSDVSFTFTSACTPPGQVLFSGLGSGTYTLTVTKPGYQTFNGTVNASANWQQTLVSLLPS